MAEYFDVAVVGAGLSGIGAAVHLQRECPDRTFVILEGRDDLGGTWDLFRYPGVRSDSDMHTLGYSFKPWVKDKAIVDGPSILEYLRETATEHGVTKHIRFGHQVVAASWSSDEARWTLTIDGREPIECNFLFMCSGYYSYRGGFTPDFAGREGFEGIIVHPQEWPEDLDYQGKRVVIVGSGATAMTLLPAMATDAAHVTMVQRSPTYVVARPEKDVIANRLMRVLPSKWAYRIVRKKNIALTAFLYKASRQRPAKLKARVLKMTSDALGEDVTREHFTPSYNPWDQRLCLIPNGDLYHALNSGAASVVTATIDHFDESGIQLDSGEHLDADIIVTATGLRLVTIGNMDFVVDGVAVDFAQTYTYRGIAYSDVPNIVATFGYINASWTLRSDLIAGFVCRLLNHMSATGTRQCTPRLRLSDYDMVQRPFITDFSSGYMQRGLPLLPRQGDRDPWRNPQQLAADRKLLLAPIDDGVMQFTAARVTEGV
ncbi:MAG TPA: NAD(P)/FAD-dependent oxidoreductase [Ilumatobacter sp.]|nr:NAD(P)/FAD-dependent oxidoreductase [Ilumatobacter sp.]